VVAVDSSALPSSIAAVFAEVTPVFATIPPILDAIPPAAQAARVTHVLAGIATILASVDTILETIAPLVTRRVSKRHSGQQRNEQCGNKSLRESHHRCLPDRRCQ